MSYKLTTSAKAVSMITKQMQVFYKHVVWETSNSSVK